MCDKKNSVLFNDTECIVLSPNFKLIDESQVLLRVPRKNNMYSVDLKNIVPKGGLTCLFEKATSNESKLWHRRLGHLNFKTMNKLVKENLVRGLPFKLFKNDQICVACQRESCTEPSYDYSRFIWVFFLATKDETSGILKSFITGIENLVDHKVKIKPLEYFNSRTRIVEENLHIWLVSTTPIVVEVDQIGTKASDNAGQARKETKPVKDYILLPLWTTDPPYSQDPKSSHDDGSKPSSDDEKKVDEDPRKESKCNDQEKEDNVNNTNNVNVAGTNEVNVVGGKISIELPFDPNMPALEDYNIFDFSRDDEDDGAVNDMNNLDTTIQVSPIPTTRIHKDHPLNQEEPKKVIHALKDPSCIEAMQKDLLQFKLQEVWTLVDLPNRKKAIGSKWVFRNKNDERGIVIRNKARLVAQGSQREEWIGL
ncbi:putative ribonuclease H-like domain-containing protein [Tanacetum coccineum]